MQNSKLRGINPRFLLAARQRASKPCALLLFRSVGSKFKIDWKGLKEIGYYRRTKCYLIKKAYCPQRSNMLEFLF